jgi:uncharacterized protein DUF4381
MSAHLDDKNLIELLDMLAPVPDPPTISLMPQTPGWVVLGIGLLRLAIWGLRALWAHHRARAYRRAALVELTATGGDPAQVAALLRRTALAGYARKQVVGLIGQDWLNFLDQSYEGNGFSGGLGQTLLAAPYQPTAPDPALADLARLWITSHRQARA